jgi:hypothetical protein
MIMIMRMMIMKIMKHNNNNEKGYRIMIDEGSVDRVKSNN